MDTNFWSDSDQEGREQNDLKDLQGRGARGVYKRYGISCFVSRDKILYFACIIFSIIISLAISLNQSINRPEKGAAWSRTNSALNFKHILQPKIAIGRVACLKSGHPVLSSEFWIYALNTEFVGMLRKYKLWTGCPNLGHATLQKVHKISTTVDKLQRIRLRGRRKKRWK